MNARKITHIAIIVACLVLAGCASTGAATPIGTQPPQPSITEAAADAPTKTPMPIATSSPTSTLSSSSELIRPIPTDRPTPENTPIPTATGYPAPTVPLSLTGPWLLFTEVHSRYYELYDSYLWALNQDGTGLTRLTNEVVHAFAVRPGSSVQNGLTIAYVTTRENNALDYDPGGSTYSNSIKLLSWPSGEVTTIAYDSGGGWTLQDCYENGGLAWSPSGNKLAFVGMLDEYDEKVNIFVYEMATQKITRITDSYVDARMLEWSSDERYVIHQGTMGHGMWQASATGMYAARADAGGVRALDESAPAKKMGWHGSTGIAILVSRYDDVFTEELRIIDIETGDYQSMGNDNVFDEAYAPEHNTLVMTQWPFPPPNTILIIYQNGVRREVPGQGIKFVEWLSQYDRFIGYTTGAQNYLISPDGQLTEIPAPEWRIEGSHRLIVSPDNQWWAWSHWLAFNGDSRESELWAGPALDAPTTLLSEIQCTAPCNTITRDNIIWSSNSQYLLWLNGQTLYVTRPPTFAPVQEIQLPGLSGAFSNAVWVQ